MHFSLGSPSPRCDAAQYRNPSPPQPFLAIEPPELFVVHCPSLPAQQPVQPPIAKPPSLAGQFPDAFSRLGIDRPTTDVAHHGPVNAQHRTGTAPINVWGSPRKLPGCEPPPAAWHWASELSCVDLLEHGVGEHRVRQQLLEPLVLLLQLAQPPGVRSRRRAQHTPLARHTSTSTCRRSQELIPWRRQTSAVGIPASC